MGKIFTLTLLLILSSAYSSYGSSKNLQDHKPVRRVSGGAASGAGGAGAGSSTIDYLKVVEVSNPTGPIKPCSVPCKLSLLFSTNAAGKRRDFESNIRKIAESLGPESNVVKLNVEARIFNLSAEESKLYLASLGALTKVYDETESVNGHPRSPANFDVRTDTPFPIPHLVQQNLALSLIFSKTVPNLTVLANSLKGRSDISNINVRICDPADSPPHVEAFFPLARAHGEKLELTVVKYRKKLPEEAQGNLKRWIEENEEQGCKAISEAGCDIDFHVEVPRGPWPS